MAPQRDRRLTSASLGRRRRGDGGSTVVVCWEQFGPYHFARFRALRAAARPRRLVGVEIARATTTYQWENVVEEEILSLYDDRPVERSRALGVGLRFARLLRRERVRAVFLPGYYPPRNTALLLAARAGGCRCVMMNDSHAGTERKGGARTAAKHLLVRLFHSALVAGAPQRRHFAGLGMRSDRIFTGYDAVDDALFRAAAAAARRDADGNRARLCLPRRYFLSVGRFVPKKNLVVLVEALAALRRSLGPARCPSLVLVGAGPDEARLGAAAAAAGIPLTKIGGAGEPPPGGGEIGVYGFRQIEELAIFYALAEAFVLPSVREEWGLVVNEAMACGLPVVVSRVAGCAEDLVEPGGNGMLFDPGSAGELAVALGWLAADDGLRVRLGRRSAEIIAGWGCDNFARQALRALAAAG